MSDKTSPEITQMKDAFEFISLYTRNKHAESIFYGMKKSRTEITIGYIHTYIQHGIFEKKEKV